MSSSRPPSARRKSSSAAAASNGDGLAYECKAAYLVIVDDTEESLQSMNQLGNALAQSGRNVPRKRLQNYWTEDTESISFEEFCEICRKEPATTEDDLMKAFKKIDINGDGFITNNELLKTLTTKGDKMTKEEVQEIIDEVDENGDGKLNYSEFCSMLLGTQEKAKKLAQERMEKKLKKRTSLKPKPSPRRKDSDTGSNASSRLSLTGNQDGLQAETEAEVHQGSPREEEERRKSVRELATEEGQLSVLHEEKDEEKEEIKTEELEKKEDSETEADNMTKTEEKEDKEEEKIDEAAEEISGEIKQPVQEESSKEAEEEEGGVAEDSEDDDDDDDDDIVIGSRVSLSSAASKTDELTSARSMARERPLPSAVSRCSKLKRPRKLSEWQQVVSGGGFYLDTEANQIISHQYSLRLASDSNVWITIEPNTIGNMIARDDPIDTQLLVLKKDGSLVTFTELRDAKGKYGVRCDLERGEYSLIPITSGCRLRPRQREPSSESKILRKKGDQYVLSKSFKEALCDIFKMCDLDGDGLLSREEFNLFNLRTSGEGVADEEWEVVEDNVDLEDGKITEEGFIALNQMEADDNEGDTDDLWVTLTCMGYNKSLEVDQACPYTIEVYAEDTEPKLRVTEIESIDDLREKAMTEATINKGESSKVRHMRDLQLHSYITDFMATYVLENKSHSRVTIGLDCSQSRNCISHQPSLDHSVEVPRGQSKLVHHLMPIDDSREWAITCVEVVIK